MARRSSSPRTGPAGQHAAHSAHLAVREIRPRVPLIRVAMCHRLAPRAVEENVFPLKTPSRVRQSRSPGPDVEEDQGGAGALAGGHGKREREVMRRGAGPAAHRTL